MARYLRAFARPVLAPFRARVVQRTTAVLFVAALAFAPAPAYPAPLDAAASKHVQLERSGFSGKFDPAILPAGANLDAPVTVIVQLNGDPAGVTGTSAADLARSQAGARSAIASQGGTILSQYQYALNGFAVRITGRRAAALATLPNVNSVKATRHYKIENVQSVPFIGAPAAWSGPDGVHGEGVKIAVIDTGIDYTHANFGGPGTVAAYNAANATDTAPADPTLFGPTSTTKVKGGTDLVGDDYDADAHLPNGDPDAAKRTPHPDPNPLDCNGHGSHVAGTAAGFGETASGAPTAVPTTRPRLRAAS